MHKPAIQFFSFLHSSLVAFFNASSSSPKKRNWLALSQRWFQFKSETKIWLKLLKHKASRLIFFSINKLFATILHRRRRWRRERKEQKNSRKYVRGKKILLVRRAEKHFSSLRRNVRKTTAEDYNFLRCT